MPFIGDCLQKIGEPLQAVKIVNNEHKKDTPDFDRTRVWKILVGGAKLSRGYREFIDFIVVGVDAAARVEPGSFQEYVYDAPEAEHPSDHCPISVRVVP